MTEAVGEHCTFTDRVGWRPDAALKIVILRTREDVIGKSRNDEKSDSFDDCPGHVDIDVAQSFGASASNGVRKLLERYCRHVDVVDKCVTHDHVLVLGKEEPSLEEVRHAAVV